jgi:hypothetical protein
MTSERQARVPSRKLLAAPRESGLARLLPMAGAASVCHALELWGSHCKSPWPGFQGRDQLHAVRRAPIPDASGRRASHSPTATLMSCCTDVLPAAAISFNRAAVSRGTVNVRVVSVFSHRAWGLVWNCLMFRFLIPNIFICISGKGQPRGRSFPAPGCLPNLEAGK